MEIHVSGDFGNLEKFLKRPRTSDLDSLGKAIVKALADATPTKSGLTAKSWGYRIVTTSRGQDLEIYNTHINDGVNIAIILHYGHGTGTGGYVPPRPYIDEAINSVYKKTINKVLEDYLK
jgi:hypothetical protein|nr:MAG TPA: type I neck protein [Caudoviricetes sp.]